jgi:hypothetical protein
MSQAGCGGGGFWLNLMELEACQNTVPVPVPHLSSRLEEGRGGKGFTIFRLN